MWWLGHGEKQRVECGHMHSGHTTIAFTSLSSTHLQCFALQCTVMQSSLVKVRDTFGRDFPDSFIGACVKIVGIALPSRRRRYQGQFSSGKSSTEEEGKGPGRQCTRPTARLG